MHPQDVSELFRRRRSDMGLSLKEAENATSIRMAYLQAIEEGTIGQVISPVYAKGFVKQYAQFLGLDGEKIVSDNPQAFRPPEKQEFAYGIGTLEVRGTPGGGVKWLPNLLWIGVGAAVLIGAYFFARYLGIF